MRAPIRIEAEPQELHVQRASERAVLVQALSTVAVTNRRKRARRFLEGLSTDELRYIASYLGACLIESALSSRPVSRGQIACQIQQYECCRMQFTGWGAPFSWSGDVQHKMILLLEYLSSCQCRAAVEVTAGSA